MRDRGSAPLRVAVLARSVYPLHGYGGLERHVGDLVTHLLRRGIGVTLLTRPPSRFALRRVNPRMRFGLPRPSRGSDSADDQLIDAFLAQPSLEVQFVPYRTFPLAGRRGTTVLDRSSAYVWFGRRAGRAAARLVDEGRADIVHGLGASALGYAQPRTRRPRARRAPFVLNPQGLEEFGAAGVSSLSARLKRIGYRPLQTAVRVCAAAADRVIATDHAIVPAVRKYLHVEPARIVVVPNAIDLEAINRTVNSPIANTVAGFGGDPLLLSVGRLEQNKGFHVLVNALATARDHSGWRWVLVGDGPYRARIERLVGQAALSDRVQLVGRVRDEDLHAWYEAADVFVHPTLYEGSSLVTLEAMAHRKPVIATRAGGLPDKVVPGVTGWLVEPGDPVSLKCAIADALNRRDALPAMGAAGRELVERTFCWTRVARQTEDLYRSLLQ